MRSKRKIFTKYLRIAHTPTNIRKRGKIVNDFINGYEAKSWFAMKCKALRGSRSVRKPNVRVQNMRRILSQASRPGASIYSRLRPIVVHSLFGSQRTDHCYWAKVIKKNAFHELTHTLSFVSL